MTSRSRHPLVCRFVVPLSAILIVLACVPAFAQDARQGLDQPRPDLLPLSHTHVGSSPFAPPDEEDTRFITDTSPGLDRGCTYRNFGPRIIQVEITRYVGEVDGSGYLVNPGALKNNGLISDKAKIRLPAFDIDINANVPGYAPEWDRITFNGHNLGLLSGDNNVWKMNEFEVPIEWVKFPSEGSDGTLPTAAENEIRIDIDVGNTELAWCMDVDWVEISFNAMAPLLLVHGTAAQANSWDGEVLTRLDGLDVVHSNDINMPGGGNGSFDGNARHLQTRVDALSKRFGAKKIHLVAHSKGGTDSRRFLGAYAANVDVEVLSLYTLGTPHAGTVQSDLASARRNLNDPHTTDQTVEDFWEADRLAWFGNRPEDPALSEQTVVNMATFNIANPYTSPAKFYNFAADADVNNNGRIEAGEATPLLPWGTRERFGTLMYRVLGNIAGITVVRRTNLWGINEWHDVSPVPTTSFQENDLVVTTASAQHPAASTLGGIRNNNHSNLKNTAVTDLLLNRIRSDFPVNVVP